MKVKTAICYIILIILYPVVSFTIDYSIYVVQLEKCSGKVYSEKVSRYRINSKNEFILPDTPFQRVIKKVSSDNTYTILLQTGRNEACTGMKPGGDYLSNSRLLNLDDPDILKLKPRFENSSDIINDIERFVENHITNKVLGIPIISASEILKNKTGDCTEHTVLAVSIIRSLGIPCRALAGMLLSEEFQGMQNVFVYHMWAEAYINDEWILVDATRPGRKDANRYIAFSYHHLQTEMPLSYLKAVSAMKSFSVEYVE